MHKINKIIDGGYCIGCGACNLASEGAISIQMNEFGIYQAGASSTADNLPENKMYDVLKVCPFSNDGSNEDRLGNRFFSRDCKHDNRLGYYNDLYIGYVAEDDFREGGSSGGVITWMLKELLTTGQVDAIAHVKKAEDPRDGILFRYGISRTVEEIKAGAKSRYYPVEMSDVLQHIRDVPGRYAVVGLPCFVKAVRLLAEIDPVIKERVVFCVGLVCGHLKSKAFADSLGLQVGIPPGELGEIDFRVKLPDCSAGNYGVYLRGAGKEVTRPTRDFLGSNWGLNFFRYPACDYCDDVFAETADMVVGDAWLPEFEKDPKGNSIVVVRSRTLQALFEAAVFDGRLVFVSSSADEIAESQAGGLRDRREGLAYRLYKKQKMKTWVPEKRVSPGKTHLSRQRRRVYRIRMSICTQSHSIWKSVILGRDCGWFMSKAGKLTKKYYRSYHPLMQRIFRKLCSFWGINNC